MANLIVWQKSVPNFSKCYILYLWQHEHESGTIANIINSEDKFDKLSDSFEKYEILPSLESQLVWQDMICLINYDKMLTEPGTIDNMANS